MGWNKIKLGSSFKDMYFKDELYQYFLHTFAVLELEESNILYDCVYGEQRFVAAVNIKILLAYSFTLKEAVTMELNYSRIS